MDLPVSWVHRLTGDPDGSPPKDHDMPMKNPPHPGLSVRHDCLEPLGLTVTQAAAMLGVSRKHLSDLVNGHSGISPEMAICLDKTFGGGASAWYRLQAAYDLTQAMKRADRIRVESPLGDRRDGADGTSRVQGGPPRPRQTPA